MNSCRSSLVVLALLASLGMSSWLRAQIPVTPANFPTGFHATASASVPGAIPYDIAAGNFDGDTTPDVVIADSAGNRVVYVQGAILAATPVPGTPAWRPGTVQVSTTVGQIATGTPPITVAAAEMNGAGPTDLVVYCAGLAPTPPSVEVLINNGNGSFTQIPQPNFTGAAFRPSSSFTSGKFQLTDVDGNGSTDVVYAADVGVMVLRNLGNGTLQPATLIPTPSFTPQAVTTADVNGDSIQDLVWTSNRIGASGNFAVSIALGLGGGAFSTTPVVTPFTGTSVFDVAAGLIAPGSARVVAVAETNAIRVYPVLTGATLGTPVSFSVPTGGGNSTRSLELMSLDGDAVQDLVFSNDNGSFGVLRGTGSNLFQPGISIADPLATGGLAIDSRADLNNDGSRDVAYCDFGTGLVGGVVNRTQQEAWTQRLGVPCVGLRLSAPEYEFAGSGPALLTILLSNGQSGGVATIFASVPNTTTNPFTTLGTCAIYINPNAFFIVGSVALNATGSGSLSVTPPAFAPAAIGLQFVLQATEPNANSPAGYDFSNADVTAVGY